MKVLLLTSTKEKDNIEKAKEIFNDLVVAEYGGLRPLRSGGYKLISEYTNAIEFLKKELFDVVLCDLRNVTNDICEKEQTVILLSAQKNVQYVVVWTHMPYVGDGISYKINETSILLTKDCLMKSRDWQGKLKLLMEKK